MTQSKRVLWYFLGAACLLSTFELILFAIDPSRLSSGGSLIGVIAYFVCFFGFSYVAVVEKVPYKYLLIFLFFFFGYVVNPIFWIVQTKRMGILMASQS
jgi:hypothetical protein